MRPVTSIAKTIPQTSDRNISHHSRNDRPGVTDHPQKTRHRHHTVTNLMFYNNTEEAYHNFTTASSELASDGAWHTELYVASPQSSMLSANDAQVIHRIAGHIQDGASEHWPG